MSRLLSNPGRTEIGADGHFHDRDLIAAVNGLRDVDFLKVIRQAIIKGLKPIDLSFDAIELRQALPQIERLALPFLDVGLQVLHLLADGFAAGLKLFDRVRAEKLDQVFCFAISSLSLMIFGCLGRRSLERVSFSALSNCNCCLACR